MPSENILKNQATLRTSWGARMSCQTNAHAALEDSLTRSPQHVFHSHKEKEWKLQNRILWKNTSLRDRASGGNGKYAQKGMKTSCDL